MNHLRGYLSIIKNGLVDENPIFRLVLGMCPTLAVTTSAINGVGMGLAVVFVLAFSNMFISMLRHFVPSQVRIPVYVVVIATFVTVLQLVMEAFLPTLYAALGLFIPLIVVNCIILARAEAFASKNHVMDSVMDGIGMGLGFTAALVAVGCVRELLGNGSIFGFSIGAWFSPALVMVMAPGGFITLGLLMGFINKWTAKKER